MNGKPFVVDSGNFRIQVFTPEVVNPSQPLPSQEICADGIDNDGDLLIDEGCPLSPSANT